MENEFDGWKEHEDEFRDFSLLLTNQLLLQIFLMELPILSYRTEFGSPGCIEAKQPFLLRYQWLGGEQNELTDSRKRFTLWTTVQPHEDEFKLIFFLAHDKATPILQWVHEEPTAVKEFIFTPSDRLGEAIVNETTVWIRTRMVEVLSGKN